MIRTSLAMACAVAMSLTLGGCGGDDRASAPAEPVTGAGFVRPAGFAGPFYGEIFVPEKNRFVVFGTKAGMEDWKKSGEMAFSRTQVGFGPKRETVVFESEKESLQVTERLKRDFAARWNLQR